MAKFFFSHVAEDEDTCVALAEALARDGVSTWYYERDSVAGDYLEQVLAAMAQAPAVIVLLSPAALASHQVHAEISYAFETGKRFVPLLAGLTVEELKRRKPSWAYMMGTAVAVALGGDPVAAVPRITAGLRKLAPPAAPPPWRSTRDDAPGGGWPFAPVRIDARPLLGDRGTVWSQPYVPDTPMYDFLGHTFLRLAAHVPPHTYGEAWILRDAASGAVFARPIADAHVPDERSIEDAGIKPGHALQVVAPDSANAR